MALHLLSYATITFLISLFTSIVIFATCFHLIVKPNYVPGMNTMPFLWYPLITSIHSQSKKKLALANTYILDALSGLCKLNENQKICSLSLLGRTYVFLFHADTAEVVLSSNKITEKSLHYMSMKPMLKDGLFMSKGSKWQSRRKLLTSTFHFKILQDFIPLVYEIAKDLLPNLKCSSDQPWIDIASTMKACSLEVFMKTALGVEIDPQAPDTKKCFDAMKRYSFYETVRSTRPWIELMYRYTSLAKKSEESISIVHTYLLKMIAEKKQKVLYARHNQAKNENVTHDKVNNEKEFSSRKKKPKAFMDLLLEHHLEDESLTEENILEETLSFFLGATVATANSLSYALYCIGLYKEVQKIVHDELDEIFGNSDRDITEEDLKSMKYLDCAIKESMRLYPMTFIGRTATDNIKVFNYTIPQKSIIVVFFHMIHRDSEIYPDPEKFDLSRFFPENCQGRPPYAFVPFSAGPRNCIAQKFAFLELKTVLASILRKYDAHSLDARDQIVRISENFPLRVRFTPRESLQHKYKSKEL